MPTTAKSKDHEEEEEGEEEEEEGIEHIARRNRGTTCDGVASVSDCGDPNSRGSGSRGSVVIRRPPPRWMVLLVGAASTTTIASGVGAVAAGTSKVTNAFVRSGPSIGRRVVGTSSHRCIFQRRNWACGNRPLVGGSDSSLRSVLRSFATPRTTRVSRISRGLLDYSARRAAFGSPRLEGYLSCAVSTEFRESRGEESFSSVGTEVNMTSSSPTVDPAAAVDTSVTSPPPGESSKHADEVSTTTGNTAKTKRRARRVPSTPDSISACAERLRRGEMVSFPTETVYGLGCNALSGDAALKIFAAKERPYTDPLISHVASADDAFALWSTLDDHNGSEAVRTLRALTDRFWPGPLTLVFDASPSVPPILTANTGRAAVRCPSHPLARALIEEAGVPIAAPSANKFGHVSPTRADHVLDDLGEEDVWVIDPDMTMARGVMGEVNGDCNGAAVGESSPKGDEDMSPCRVGVESTVALVDRDARTVSVLRHGAVSPGDIRECLTAAGVEGYRVVDVKKRQEEEELVASEKGRGRPSRSSDEDDDDDCQRGGGARDVAEKTTSTTVVVGDVSPGQTVRHYSPHVPSFLISSDRYHEDNNHHHRNGEVDTSSRILRPGEEETLRRAVVIDFGGRLSFVRDRCLAYRDLSPEGSSSEAASNVFESLRWAECVDGAERVYFPEIVSSSPSSSAVGVEEEEDALTLALRDRLTRAASAVVTDEFR